MELSSSTGIKASVIRPGYFFPTALDRDHTRGTGARIMDCIFTPLYSTLLPSTYTAVEGMAKVALALAKGQWRDESLVRSKRMNEMMKELGEA